MKRWTHDPTLLKVQQNNQTWSRKFSITSKDVCPSDVSSPFMHGPSRANDALVPFVSFLQGGTEQDGFFFFGKRCVLTMIHHARLVARLGRHYTLFWHRFPISTPTWIIQWCSATFSRGIWHFGGGGYLFCNCAFSRDAFRPLCYYTLFCRRTSLSLTRRFVFWFKIRISRGISTFENLKASLASHTPWHLLPCSCSVSQVHAVSTHVHARVCVPFQSRCHCYKVFWWGAAWTLPVMPLTRVRF